MNNNNNSPNSSQSTTPSQQPQQHYAYLINTVTELKTNVDKCMLRIQSLEEENINLSKNHESVKEELATTRTKYNEAKDCYMQTVAEKLEAERQYETFIERVKIQLVEKTKDFEQLREKLIPHDIDQLRIKVQEELEIQHKQQLQSIEQELDRQRDAFFDSKREYEKSKAEYESLIQNQQQEIVSIRQERDEVESSLRQQLVDQQVRTVEYIPSKDDKLRGQRSKIAELQHLLEAVREESRACRAERDQLAMELEKNNANQEEELTRVRASLHTALAERAALEEKLSRLLLECEQKDGQVRGLRAGNDDLSERADAAAKLQQEAERALSLGKEEIARQLDACRQAFEADRAELQEALSGQTEKVHEREELVRRTQREISDMQIKAEAMESDLRRAHQSHLTELRKKYSAVELELAELKRAQKAAESQASHTIDKVGFELEAAQSELSRLRREKDVMHSKLREAELLLDAEKRATAAMKQDYGGKVKQAEAQNREAKVVRTALESRLRECESALQSLLDTTNAQLEQQKSKMAAEMAEVSNHVVPQIERVKRDMHHMHKALEKEKRKAELFKKKAEAYKKKAIEGHERNKHLQSMLSHLSGSMS